MLGILLIIAYRDDLYSSNEKYTGSFLAISGVTLLDRIESDPLADMTIIINNGEIIQVQRQGELPDGAQVLNYHGSFVMPSLIDAAVYFQAPANLELDLMEGEWMWEITRSTPEHRRALDNAGIALVQDLGSEIDSINRTRKQLSDRDINGPQLLTTGPILTTSGGCPGTERFPHRLKESTLIIGSVEEGIETVKMLDGKGINGISICYTSRGGEFALMDEEVLKAIIQEAINRDLLAFVETSSLLEAKQAVSDGATALVGGVSIDGEQVDRNLLEMMVDSGTVYIPTLAAIEARQSDGPESLTTALMNTGLVNEVGIPVAAGSGTAGPGMWFGSSLIRELELLVQAGFSNRQALKASLNTAAVLLGRDPVVIQEGRRANFIVLDGNPLEDIGTIKNVHMLIKGTDLVQFSDEDSR